MCDRTAVGIMVGAFHQVDQTVETVTVACFSRAPEQAALERANEYFAEKPERDQVVVVVEED